MASRGLFFLCLYSYVKWQKNFACPDEKGRTRIRSKEQARPGCMHARRAHTIIVHTQAERSASTAAEFLMIPMLIGTCSTREILEPGDTEMRDELRVGMRLDLL